MAAAVALLEVELEDIQAMAETVPADLVAAADLAIIFLVVAILSFLVGVA
jgi:hypothetical protein